MANLGEQVQCFVFITFFHNCGHTSTRKHCRDKQKIWASGTHKHPHAACDDACDYTLPYYSYMWDLACTWCRQHPNIPRTSEERSDMPAAGQPDPPLPMMEILQRRHTFMTMMRVQREGQARLAPYEVNHTDAPLDILMEMLIRHDSNTANERLRADINGVPLSDRTFEVGALHENSELFSYVDARTYPDIHQDDCGICLTSINNNSIRSLPCGHIYHLICIYEWLARSDPKTCPTCRQTYNIVMSSITENPDEAEADIDAAAILTGM